MDTGAGCGIYSKEEGHYTCHPLSLDIFDPMKATYPHLYWSHRGVGCFLSQRSTAPSSPPPPRPDCCSDGWYVILAMSRFLSLTEQCYTPRGGEEPAMHSVNA